MLQKGDVISCSPIGRTTIKMAAMWGMSPLLRENIFSLRHVVNNNYGNAREERRTDRKDRPQIYVGGRVMEQFRDT